MLSSMSEAKTEKPAGDPATPDAVTIVGVSLRVIPMKPIFAPLRFLIAYAGRIVLLVPAYLTFAAR